MAKKVQRIKEVLDAMLQEATSLLGEKEISQNRKKAEVIWNFIGTPLLV